MDEKVGIAPPVLKRRWERPKLIELVRPQPGESVLLACKTSFAETGPASFHLSCIGVPACDICSDVASS